jgi:predicted secreted protein
VRFTATRAIRFVGGLIVLVVAVACGSPRTPNQWIDDGVHAVDGYWMLKELPCDLVSSEACVTTARIVETQLGIDATQVVRAAIAAPPRRWLQSDGQVAVVLFNSSGSPPEFVILDLADGSRRATGFGCGGVPGPDGSPFCLAFALDQYQVGHSPIDAP